MLKPGRTAKGAEAAASHTKSIAGSDKVFDSVCKQIGLIRAEGIAEFYDYAKILGLIDKPAGNRLMIITSSGGSGILATDTAEDLGIRLEKLEPSIVKELRDVLPNQCVLSNPLELTGDATAQRYQDALEVAIKASNADAYLVIFGDPIENASQTLKIIKQKTDKPILAAYLGGGDVEKHEVPLMNASGYTCIPNTGNVLYVLWVRCCVRNRGTSRNFKGDKTMQKILYKAGERELLMGNEAIARGAVEAGIQAGSRIPWNAVVGNYRSSHGSFQRSGFLCGMEYKRKGGLLKSLQGASMVGGRTMVTMKNAGLNVAMDTFMTIPYGGNKRWVSFVGRGR